MATFRSWSALSAVFALSAASVSVSVSCGDEKVNPLPQGGAGGTAATTTTGTGGTGPVGVSIPGLSAPVKAVYDQDGLLHLQCATDDDCFAALGYFHASNRFFFMDFVRNLVRGSLGSLVRAGDLVLQKDYQNRQFFTTRTGQPLEEKIVEDATPSAKASLAAYTKGVNAWIGDMRTGRNGATLTTEYDFPLIVKANIRDWQPEDCAAIELYVLNDLANNSGSELALAQQIPAFAPALSADLFSPRPVFDAFTIPAATLNLTAPHGFSSAAIARVAPFGSLLGDAVEAQRKVGSGSSVDGRGEIGSNNWVLGPSRTTSGNALLANDPHLLLTNPSIWFPVEIDAKSAGTGSYHVAGSTFPGDPVVLLGHNESIGWGATVAYYDLADEYIEQVSLDGKTVKFNGQDVAILEKDFTFQDAKSGVPVTKTFRWVPHHGPIVSEDTTAHTAISIRWVAHEGGTDLDAFLSLGRSGDVEAARKSLESISVADQNFVIVDKTGNIAWYPYAKVPSRPWASQALPPWLPLPGDGSAEWQGYVPLASLPQLKNPIKGMIATANNDMTGASADGDLTNDGQPAFQAWDKAEGTREQRVVDLIAAGANAHSVDTMNVIQGDTHSLYGGVVVPLVLAAAQGQTLTAPQQAVVDALTAWKLTCPTGLDGSDPAQAAKSSDPDVAAEAVGCMAFHTTLYAIVQEAIGDEQTAAMVPTIAGNQGLHLVVRALKDPASLTSGNLLWDDVSTVGPIETRDEILLRGVKDAATVLGGLGASDEWRWGRYHTLSLRSPFASFGFTTYNAGPYAAPGGQYTVNVANPINRTLPTSGAPDFAFGSGPSVRFVVEAKPTGLTMTYELPGGADLHHDSPFYNNLLPNWLINKPIDFPFGPGAVTNPAKTIDVLPLK